MAGASNIDVFCRVVDNFGDAGVCWRLARQLAAERGLRVRLWIDDLAALGRIEPAFDAHVPGQRCRGVEVLRWNDAFAAVDPAEAVIEAFGCGLPEPYLEAMARLPRKPCWINLEYLSAEPWTRTHHGLPSPHPRLPLTKYFYFPGFGADTGGLLRERGLAERRNAFRASAAGQAAFWQRLGLAPVQSGELRVSLFCYANEAAGALLAAWAGGGQTVHCVVPEGPVLGSVARFFGAGKAAAGDVFTRGNLTLRVLPFVDQDSYDRLLWACDLNFVRGEDSFVRAQWAGRPLVWQAYPQAEGAHFAKLAAFLDLYCAELAAPAGQALRGLTLAWNGAAEAPELAAAWAACSGALDALARHAERWEKRQETVPDLAARLVEFMENRVK